MLAVLLTCLRNVSSRPIQSVPIMIFALIFGAWVFTLVSALDLFDHCTHCSPSCLDWTSDKCISLFELSIWFRCDVSYCHGRCPSTPFSSALLWRIPFICSYVVRSWNRWSLTPGCTFFFVSPSLIKDYKQRPKYIQLMLQPFFIQARDQTVDVAGWYRHVTTAAITDKQARWWPISSIGPMNTILLISIRCISHSFFACFFLSLYSVCVICTWLWFRAVFINRNGRAKDRDRRLDLALNAERIGFPNGAWQSEARSSETRSS